MFKDFANLGNVLRQAQQMGSRMQEIQAELAAKRAEGVAGGGMVRVEVNGQGKLLKVSIEPHLVEQNEREMIEDLVVAAVNDAAEKARQLHLEAMKSLTDGVDMPGLNQMLERFVP